MSSIKCKKCGLVNFDYATECKRCLNPFNNKQSRSSHYQDFQTPPAPPVFGRDGGAVHNDAGFQPKPPCIKCGNNQNISIRNFKKIYNSPIAIIGIFLGVLPYLLLALLLRTTHHLSAPFCHDCWGKYKNADTYTTLLSLGAFVGLVGSIILAVALESLPLVVVGFVATLGLYIYGNMYVKKISPKFKKVDSKQVVIDAPFVGDVLFTK